MKKHLLIPGLLLIPALAFLAIENNQVKQITAKPVKVISFCCSGEKEKAKTTWDHESENKTGRLLTYFWADQADNQTRL